MKRKFDQILDKELINEYRKKFNNSKDNKVTKNVITNVGLINGSTDHNEANKISHIFLNTIKKKNLKATNQGVSGRCWLFSGLNMFRHNVIKALNLDNFEFSETYLFFWDKFERSNTYLNWFGDYILKNEKIDTNDHLYSYLVEKDKWLSDGGYWNFFVNLVNKYGLLPKDAMPETFQSEYSEDMNDIIIDTLHSASIDMIENKSKINKIKKETIQKIYIILCKFLGEPPTTFKWTFSDENGESTSIGKLNSMSFKELVIPSLDLNEFVLLANIPNNTHGYYNKYTIKYSSNTIEGNNCEFINIPIEDLKNITKKSLLSGVPVWFGADVNKGFHPYLSCLSKKVINTDLLLDTGRKLNKKERFFITNQKISHAMTLLGVNIGEKGNTTSWQVENSWGFFDNETPGMDGFLYMDDDWFENYVGEVVVHKKFLTRKITPILNKESIYMEPWESVAPALRIDSTHFNKQFNPNYKKILV